MGLSMVILEKDRVEEEITNQYELEKVVMEENKAKFTQCGNTAFYQQPLKNDFDEACTSRAYDQVLDGTYKIPKGTNRFAKMILEYMKNHPELEEISLVIDLEKFCSEWSQSKETTLSGISGLHFGHIIAMCRESEKLSKVLKMMAEITLRTGHTLRRRLQSLNVMLLKKLGVHNMEKLQTIQLYEPDLNKNQKIMAEE